MGPIVYTEKSQAVGICGWNRLFVSVAETGLVTGVTGLVTGVTGVREN